MENTLQDTMVFNKKNAGLKQYLFELPTRVTKLEPVFYLTFNINNIKTDINTVNVALNPKLTEQSDISLVKKYQFNSDGTYIFDNEEFNGYYIEGEMQIMDSDNSTLEKSCFVSITYGNKDEALHFIKGKFKLAENIT